MLLNFIYSLFFGLIDLIIFSILTKNIKLPNYVFKIGIIALIIFIILNSFAIFELVQYYQFVILLYFSLGLIVLHFMSEFSIKIFKKRVLYNSEISTRITEIYFNTIDFVRLKLIYFMMFTFQLLVIWANLSMK
jgi:hypothetical protein